MTAFLVCEFGKSAISNLIKECFGSDFPEIFRKPQVDYIYRYLKDLGAATVLLETQYVDKDFLNDFSKFYVRRFSSTAHRCARLHFFSKSLTHQEFESWLGSGLPMVKQTEIKASYLGFVVVKPLPRTFIGKTCLHLYPSFSNSDTRILLSRDYDVSLFGIELKVRTIAFQEQDKVVAACATTAIWVALNAIRFSPVRSIPSCSEITASAINFVSGSSNSFPSSELSQKQILRAVDVAGYRHHSHLLRHATVDEIFDLIACYLRSGIPMILGAEVDELEGGGATRRTLGAHATTILGCDTRPETRALYIHDDRLGPFARARVLQQEEDADGVKPGVKLCLQEKDDSGAWQDAKESLVMKSLVAVTDKKVRLPLMLAWQTCALIRSIYVEGLQQLERGNALSVPADAAPKLTYRLELAEISTLKAEILNQSVNTNAPSSGAAWSFADWHPDPYERRSIFLSRPFARLQWVGRFELDGRPAFLVTIDATDIPQGDAVSAVYVQDAMLFEAFFAVFNTAASQAEDMVERDSTFFGSFMRRVAPRRDSLADFLDGAYGKPRAPSRLKAEETTGGKIAANANLRRYFAAVDTRLEDALGPMFNDADYLIWVIDHEGTLLVGREDQSQGHPTLTGFKPARVGGELRRDDRGWFMNSKSGRYSNNYADPRPYLRNALAKFQSIFYMSRDELRAEECDPLLKD